MQGAKVRTQGAEVRTQGAKVKTQGAEVRTQGAKMSQHFELVDKGCSNNMQLYMYRYTTTTDPIRTSTA